MSSVPKSDQPIEKRASKNLKRAYNIMHVAMFKLFKNIEITAAQFDLMETVLLSENQALSIQDLASRTTSLQPNITRMVSELENANFVERSGGPDRRTVFVQLTPKGRQLVADIQKPLLELHVSQYKTLSKEELYMLNELLIKISKDPGNP